MSLVVLAGLLLRVSAAQAAPDYEAVDRRLRNAVAAGELTSAEADEMMRVLRVLGGDTTPEKVEAERDGHDASKRRIGAEDIIRADEEVNEALEAGTLTVEEGRVRLNAMRKLLAAQRVEDRMRSWRREYAELEAELGELVAEGKLTEAEKNERLEAMRRSKPKDDRAREASGEVEAKIAEYREALDESVKMGALSEAAARRMLEAYTNRLRAGGSKGSNGARGADLEAREALRARMKDVRAAIDADVEAGKITSEQGEVRWEAYLEDLRECTGGPLPRWR